jgi:hypothetical protein
MIHAMAYCVGGDRLTEFDPLRALVSWVECGTPPDRIIATARDTQGTVLRSRPVFPYPLRAEYDGTGSIDDANNFIPAPPRCFPPRHHPLGRRRFVHQAWTSGTLTVINTKWVFTGR